MLGERPSALAPQPGKASVPALVTEVEAGSRSR